MSDSSAPRDTRDPAATYPRIVALLATLLLANPAVLYLATGSVTWTLAATLVAVIATQATFWHGCHRLVRVHVFNALAVLSFFVHGEAILIHAFPDFVVENLYQIRSGYYFNWPRLNQQFRDKEFDVTYRTNAQGLRIGVLQDMEKTTTTADWLVLGDSFTQGAQVEFEELYTTQLYRHFPHKIVVNAGISGFGVGHEYNYFVDAGVRFSPELVILQLCSFNDFMTVEPSLVGFTDRLMTHSAFVRLLLAGFKFRNPHELPLGRWTEPFQKGRQANADFNIFYNDTSEQKQRDWAAFRSYIARMKSAVERSGGRLLVVLIPTKEQVYPHYLEEVQRALQIASTDLDMLRPNRQMQALATEYGFDFLDLLDAFRKSENRVFYDFDEHMNANGHRVMSNAIAAHLESRDGVPGLTFLSRRLSGDRYPSPSPDGMLIAYQSLRDGNMEVFVARQNLEQDVRITVNAVHDSHPSILPSGDEVILTQGDAETFRTDVVALRLDGKGQRDITAGENLFGAIPAVSETDRRLAYAEWSYDPASRKYSSPRIAVLDPRDGHKMYISPEHGESWRPVFSPDGKSIAYIFRDGRQPYDVFLYDLPEGTTRRLTDTAWDEWDPAFTPDGKRLVYSAHADGNWDLFVLDIRTAAATRLTRTRGDEWDAAVAPGGRELYFAGVFGLIDGVYRMPFR